MAYKYEDTGIVTRVSVNCGVSKKTGKYWQSRLVVVQSANGVDGHETNNMLEYFGKAFDETECLEVGDAVRFTFTIDTREWNGRVFHSISAGRIEKLDADKVDDGGVAGTDAGGDEDVPF